MARDGGKFHCEVGYAAVLSRNNDIEPTPRTTCWMSQTERGGPGSEQIPEWWVFSRWMLRSPVTIRAGYVVVR